MPRQTVSATSTVILVGTTILPTVNKIHFQAKSTNTGIVWIDQRDTVTSDSTPLTAGIPLAPGDVRVFDFDDLDPSWYVIGTANDYLYVNPLS